MSIFLHFLYIYHSLLQHVFLHGAHLYFMHPNLHKLQVWFELLKFFSNYNNNIFLYLDDF